MDDVLRGSLNRTKYRDVILPMTVIRRLDALLEPTKQQVLDTWAMAEERGIGEQRHGLLENAARQPFYNTSQFTLRRLIDNPKNIHGNLLAFPGASATASTTRPPPSCATPSKTR